MGFLKVARHTKGHFKVWATIFTEPLLQVLLGLKQGFPFTVHTDVYVGLGIIHQMAGRAESTISLTLHKQLWS